MEIMLIVALVISAVLTPKIVNGFNNFVMKLLGLDVMFISVKGRIVAYVGVFLVLFGILASVLAGGAA